MNKIKPNYCFFQKFSAIGMIGALVWLTISAPFVFYFHEKMGEIEKNQSSNTDKKDSNPFANTTEEKTSSTNTFSEEYLHHTEEHNANAYAANNLYNHSDESLYKAFHGELVSPPPDINFYLF
jgi:hypothetical protein